MNPDAGARARADGRLEKLATDLRAAGELDEERLAAFDALASKAFDPTGLRTLMSVRIMVAVRDGERDCERLKELALEVVAEAY